MRLILNAYLSVCCELLGVVLGYKQYKRSPPRSYAYKINKYNL